MAKNSLFRKKSIAQVLSNDATGESHGLAKVLGVRDLTSLGIAAIIGAGIFSTIGRASFDGGPAVSLLFVFTAIACVFTALSYAQFASTVPVSGSAYTYAYVSFGELFAWIIGWALILEYAVSNMVVAISWSEYFTSMLAGFGMHLPEWLTVDPASAKPEVRAAAPVIAGIRIICDLPAGLITALVTALVYVGIRESRNASNLLVALKLAVILLVIGAGVFYVKPENWSPFAPNGVGGVLSGVAAVFFAFIGFDSISTTAEECVNPQRDLPKAMIYCLAICTVLYVAITLVLTGMVHYKELNVDDPLAYVFHKVGFDFVAGVISVSAVIAITSALLVYQLGQPRIWMTMSRDGLLWPKFAKVHPKYHTPSFATIVTGLVVAIPSMFFDMGFFVDLTSVGTFFAFILVCSGVLYLDYKGLTQYSKFRVPYVNGQYIIGLGFLIAFGFALKGGHFILAIEEKPLLFVFWITWAGLSVAAFRLKFSLLPVLGILTNLYLMTELGISNWGAFAAWLVIGLVIYFGYGHKHSRLAKAS
ncbi:amino acid permease [Siphonobacter aquaeclarae]|uniref:Amino acid/polyamine/organocation transporter, APC superfamily n=1 Tax=Siphonobacter aquaeclarae TaxID=563176 RepID=A0A1G9PNX2_9BACT|nr:amino acid permease [Siphonobacter aquaeclarae]MBO9638934.1 amino acid permease [Siphonobacter aquaeclarae]SDM00191.1 amino acid/polyamine/organocation transporter, APC superfamily [Siphonobacter aquaeclarae]